MADTEFFKQFVFPKINEKLDYLDKEGNSNNYRFGRLNRILRSIELF